MNNDKPKMKLVSGLMRNRAEAERAVTALFDMGFKREDISVLMSDATRSKHFALETGTKTAEGAGIGGAVGGTVGAVVAAIAAIGTNLVLPGLGLIVAGPLAAAFAGAGAGGAIGTLVGGLVGTGIPEHEAKAYESALKAGGILIGVEARDEKEVDTIKRILEAAGGKGIEQERMKKASGQR